MPVRDRVVHGVPALLPRDRVDGEEPGVVLAPALGDVEAARGRQVALGRPDTHLALDLVDVDGLPLVEGLFATLHGERKTAGGHLALAREVGLSSNWLCRNAISAFYICPGYHGPTTSSNDIIECASTERGG